MAGEISKVTHKGKQLSKEFSWVLEESHGQHKGPDSFIFTCALVMSQVERRSAKRSVLAQIENQSTHKPTGPQLKQKPHINCTKQSHTIPLWVAKSLTNCILTRL